MKVFLFILLILVENIHIKKHFEQLLLFISAVLLFSGCCSNEVLKKFTITVDCESMAGRSHNEFQADSCFRIGDRFIAFRDKDSVVYNITEFCGKINIKCNKVNSDMKEYITEEELSSAQKK